MCEKKRLEIIVTAVVSVLILAFFVGIVSTNVRAAFPKTVATMCGWGVGNIANADDGTTPEYAGDTTSQSWGRIYFADRSREIANPWIDYFYYGGGDIPPRKVGSVGYISWVPAYLVDKIGSAGNSGGDNSSSCYDCQGFETDWEVGEKLLCVVDKYINATDTGYTTSTDWYMSPEDPQEFPYSTLYKIPGGTDITFAENTMSWAAVGDAHGNVYGYKTYRADVQGGPYSVIGNTAEGAGDTSFTNATVAAGKWYRISVLYKGYPYDGYGTWTLDGAVESLYKGKPAHYNTIAPIITEYYPTTNQTINETENITFIITASDLDGDNIYYSWYLDDEPVVGEINNSFAFYTNYSSAGNYTVKVVVSDGELSANHTWNLTILNVNQRPNIDSYLPLTNQTILETQTQMFSVNASDPDNDTLTYQWYLDNSLLINETNLFYIFVPPENASGNYTIKVVISDGNLSDNHTWIVTVINVEQLQQTINELQNQLNQMIENNTELQAIISQLNDNLSSLWNQLNESLINNTELQNDIILLTQNLVKTWSELNQSLSNNTGLQRYINQLNNTLNLSAAQISALWAQLNQSSINETTLQNQLSSLNENITNLQKQIVRLESEKETAENEREQSAREFLVIIVILLSVVVIAWISAGLVRRKKE